MIKNLIGFVILSFFITLNAFAESSAIANVVWVKGSFSANGRALQKSSPIYQNEVLRTAANSQAQVVFSDNSLMTFKENTTFSVDNYRFTKNANAGSFIGNLITGGFRTITGAIAKHNPADYQVKTPIRLLGVRGTDYQAVMNNGALYVEVFRGRVCMNNAPNAPAPRNSGFENWVSEPAVYVPQVLTKTEEKIEPNTCPNGIKATFLGGLNPNQTTFSGIGNVNFAPYFSGTDLTYAIASISPAFSGTDTVTIDPITGVLSFNSDTTLYHVVVSATNSCGIALTNSITVGPSII